MTEMKTSNKLSKVEIHEKISEKVKESADTIKELLRSVKMDIEEKIAIEDQVNDFTKEAESMLDRIEVLTITNQQKILFAYKKFLEQNLEAVNQRLKELEK